MNLEYCILGWFLFTTLIEIRLIKKKDSSSINIFFKYLSMNEFNYIYIISYLGIHIIKVTHVKLLFSIFFLTGHYNNTKLYVKYYKLKITKDYTTCMYSRLLYK